MIYTLLVFDIYTVGYFINGSRDRYQLKQILGTGHLQQQTQRITRYWCSLNNISNMRRRKVVPHELGSVSDSSVVDSLPKLDLFPKIEREYNVQTTEGGALSIITYVFTHV